MLHLITVVCPLLFYSIACIGMGSWVMRFFAHRPMELPMTEIVLAFLLGQGILGSLLLFPALAGQFTLPVLLCLITPFACFGLWYLYGVSGTFPTAIGRLYREFRSAPLTWQIMSLVVLFFLIASGCSAAAAMFADAKAFYMVLPKIAAASHRLIPLPMYEDFTAVGLLAEMQLAALFLLGMPGGSARLFCWLTALAGSVILIAISRRAGLARRSQIITLAMILTSSAAALLWGTGKTDIFAAAYGLCGYFYAFRSWDEVSRKDAVILTGLFTGFSLVAKLSYIVAFLPGVCILLFWKDMQNISKAWQSHEQRLVLLRQCTVAGLLFGVAATIAFVPQLAKNWILYGDALRTLGIGYQWFSPEITRRIVLTYPLVLTYGSYWGQLGTMSPLLLAFGPLFLLAPYSKAPWNGAVVALAVAAMAGLVIWIILFPAIPMPRYFLATLILLFVPAAWSAEKFSSWGRMSAYVIWAGTLLMLIVCYRMWWGEIFHLRNAYRNVISEQIEGAPAEVEVDSYAVHKALNQIAEPGARVYTMTYFKFLLRPDLIQCATKSSEVNGYFDSGNPEKFWHLVYTHGFTYILAEDDYNAVVIDSLMKAKPEWVTVEQIAKQGTWGAYRIYFKGDPSEKVLYTTREVAPGAWDVIPVD